MLPEHGAASKGLFTFRTKSFELRVKNSGLPASESWRGLLAQPFGFYEVREILITFVMPPFVCRQGTLALFDDVLLIGDHAIELVA